ncbi:hypothetical protein BDV95DRAFT_596962 [Massariosphaeria phaeospora]|uniref:Protein kinase domain-containing protein n=1 Tax=Massariosphaeria phaeospora TaxID=100035 RepID=A0A7C8I9M8_9PLEO|nr:hypothetical protein BDV95DRAFT_596962 [Massariosphaeria phaeospora]
MDTSLSDDVDNGLLSERLPQIQYPHYFEFKGKIFTMSDGTRWQLLEPLSCLATQQVNPPGEARQVFSCKCLDPPWPDHGDAVVKIKYQVRAQDKSIRNYEGWIQEYEQSMKRYPETAAEDQSEIDFCRYLIHAATNPTNKPNRQTLDEIAALERLGSKTCEHAPWLYEVWWGTVQPDIHEGIVGGYMALILMKKVPGKRLSYYEYWKLSLAQRDEIRQAFKKALTAVWECGVRPLDKAMRSIVWDERDRTCYIVDFEDAEFYNETDERQEFTDRDYRAWDLAESCFRGW